MANEGAFNVNSVSIDAWAAVLGGLRNAKRTSSTGNPLNGENPFARFDHPSADRNQWNGLLNLTDDQLRILATRIVDVVRERGPFLGVADFVNRRLATESENTWRNGALDEALTRAALANGPSRGPATRKNGGPATNVAEAFRTKEDHAADFRLDGNPDVIEQGDLLEPLAPSLTARGDSFRIRATGISYFPDGRIASRQTCEVTVVRSPEYLFSSPFDQVGSRTTGNSALEPPMLPIGYYQRTNAAQPEPPPAEHPLRQALRNLGFQMDCSEHLTSYVFSNDSCSLPFHSNSSTAHGLPRCWRLSSQARRFMLKMPRNHKSRMISTSWQ